MATPQKEAPAAATSAASNGTLVRLDVQPAGHIKSWSAYAARHVKELKQVAESDEALHRLYRQVTAMLLQDEKLGRCTVKSVFRAMQKAAECRLEPNSSLGECYLVPYNRKVKDPNGAERWENEAQFQLGYRGMIVLARRSGFVTNISAGVVYKCDDFQFERGLVEVLRHVPRSGSHADSEITYVWCVITMRTGDKLFDAMTKEDVDKIRARSKSGQSGPWVTDYAQMSIKTVVKRTLKLAPMSIRDAALYANVREMVATDDDQDKDDWNIPALPAAPTEAQVDVPSGRTAGQIEVAQALAQSAPHTQPEYEFEGDESKEEDGPELLIPLDVIRHWKELGLDMTNEVLTRVLHRSVTNASKEVQQGSDDDLMRLMYYADNGGKILPKTETGEYPF